MLHQLEVAACRAMLTTPPPPPPRAPCPPPGWSGASVAAAYFGGLLVSSAAGTVRVSILERLNFSDAVRHLWALRPLAGPQAPQQGEGVPRGPGGRQPGQAGPRGPRPRRRSVQFAFQAFASFALKSDCFSDDHPHHHHRQAQTASGAAKAKSQDNGWSVK